MVLFARRWSPWAATPTSLTDVTPGPVDFGCVEPSKLSDWSLEGLVDGATADATNCPSTTRTHNLAWAGKAGNYPLGHTTAKNTKIAGSPLHVFKLQKVGGDSGCPDTAKTFETCEVGCRLGYSGNNIVYQCQPTKLAQANQLISTTVKMFSTSSDQTTVDKRNPKCNEQLCEFYYPGPSPTRLIYGLAPLDLIECQKLQPPVVGSPETGNVILQATAEECLQKGSGETPGGNLDSKCRSATSCALRCDTEGGYEARPSTPISYDYWCYVSSDGNGLAYPHQTGARSVPDQCHSRICAVHVTVSPPQYKAHATMSCQICGAGVMSAAKQCPVGCRVLTEIHGSSLKVVLCL